MESDSGESTGGIIDLSQLSKLSAASPAVLYSTQQSSHDVTSGQANQGEDQAGSARKEAITVDGKDTSTQPPTCWQDENPLSILSSSREFSLIEDEKFDFLIPEEYLNESIDGSCGRDRQRDCTSRIGGIVACSSPIHQADGLRQSVYDNALLQLRHRGRADLLLDHQQQHRGKEEEEEDEGKGGGEVGALCGSEAVHVPEDIPPEHTQDGSLQEEAGAVDNAFSFAEEHCSISQTDKSPAIMLIDLGVSPSPPPPPPPPRLNTTQTLDVSTDVVLEIEGQCCGRNATFTLNESLLEGSTSGAAGGTKDGSNCTTEEAGQRPTRLPSLAKWTQANLVNADVTVQFSDYAIMRDVWKEQMQTAPQLAPDGGSALINVLAPKEGATTATIQLSETTECGVSSPPGEGEGAECSSSTFVKEREDTSPDESPSSPLEEAPKHNTTRTLETDGSSDAVSLPVQDKLRSPGTTRSQLNHPKGKSQPSVAPKRQTKLTDIHHHQEPAPVVNLKGPQGHSLSAVPRRSKSLLRAPKRPLPSHPQAPPVPDSSCVARNTLDAARVQQKKNTLTSPDAASKEKPHRRSMSLHREALPAPLYMPSHYQSTPVHTGTPKCLAQPIHTIQPNFSLSSIEGSDPAHRVTVAQKSTTPHSQNRRRSGIPTSASSDKATARPTSAQKPHRTRRPDPSLSPQLPKPPPMQRALQQPKAIPRIALHDKNTFPSTARGPVAPGKTKAVKAVVSHGAENRRRSRLAVPGLRGESAA